MRKLLPYFKILRPGNAFMTATAVALGFWLSGSLAPPLSIVSLVLAAICSVGFGNIINDILDIKSDRISHPNRPLPKNEISITTAILMVLFLGVFSIIIAFLVSTIHGIGTVAPIALLTVYAFFLKGTPLAGNFIVSLLVGYAIVFGGLTAPFCSRLIIPASLAFLLNSAREIVKDFQDEPGDQATGIATTAALPKALLKSIVLGVSITYMLLLFIPYFLGQFGFVYCIASAIIALPLHFYWSSLVLRQHWEKSLATISFFIKMEMLAGLLALTADQAYFLIIVRYP